MKSDERLPWTFNRKCVNDPLCVHLLDRFDEYHVLKIPQDDIQIKDYYDERWS